MDKFDDQRRKAATDLVDGWIACDTAEYIQIFSVPIKDKTNGKRTTDANKMVTVKRIIQNSETNSETGKPVFWR